MGNLVLTTNHTTPMMKLFIISITLAAATFSYKNMTDREVLKQEIFVQKLASKMNHHLRQRNKRDISSIQHPPHLTEQFQPFSKKEKVPSLHNLMEEDENTHCTRRSIKINFDDIGWTHILAPKEIEYYYCVGVCDPITVGPKVFTTSAAFVLYKLGLSPNTVIDASCCSPSHLTGIELLVQTQPDDWETMENPMDNLEVITIPDILVTSCGCN